jgi:membrane protein
LTDDAVNKVVERTLDQVVSSPRFDVISIGFILSLWSGSRALNVFVDTITIMYGLGGQRSLVKTRMLSFVLYVLGLVTGVVTIPLVVAGPSLVESLVPERFDLVNALYWPAVVVLSICFLATLYHASVPVRTSWRYNLPGATLTLVIWVFGSFLLRWVLTTTAGESTSIYGPLAAPIAVLLWLYLLSIAVLIGAAVNAAFDRVWPESETARARLERVRRLATRLPRLRREQVESTPEPE